jgi:hypothetical protein
MLITMLLKPKTLGSKDTTFMISTLTPKMDQLFFIYVEKQNVTASQTHLILHK